MTFLFFRVNDCFCSLPRKQQTKTKKGSICVDQNNGLRSFRLRFGVSGKMFVVFLEGQNGRTKQRNVLDCNSKISASEDF